MKKQDVIKYLKNYKKKLLKRSNYFSCGAVYIDNCILLLKEDTRKWKKDILTIKILKKL